MIGNGHGQVKNGRGKESDMWKYSKAGKSGGVRALERQWMNLEHREQAREWSYISRLEWRARFDPSGPQRP